MIEPVAEHMRRAVRLAVANVDSGHGGPFGAVVTRGAVILAEAANQVTRTNDPTAHAEIVAIRRACAELDSFRLDGCAVYCSCEPCPMCLGALYWARPAAVFYAGSRHDAAAIGFDDAVIWDELGMPAPERRLPMARFLTAEASAPLEAWAASTTKTSY